MARGSVASLPESWDVRAVGAVGGDWVGLPRSRHGDLWQTDIAGERWASCPGRPTSPPRRNGGVSALAGAPPSCHVRGA